MYTFLNIIKAHRFININRRTSIGLTNLLDLTGHTGLLESKGTGLLELVVRTVLVEFIGCIGLRASTHMFIKINRTQRFIRINSTNINSAHELN